MELLARRARPGRIHRGTPGLSPAAAPHALAFALSLALAFAPATARPARAEEPRAINVVSYNLANYLVMERRSADNRPAPKPEVEIFALLRVLKDIRPDILGVCEIGAPDQFDDFRKRLAREGLDFPHAEYLAAADPHRRLALLSRFPIVARHSVADLKFPLAGGEYPVQRGFLDVTVEVNPGYRLRLVGVHLKSKRPVPEGEAIIRRNEAHLLRKHLDRILEKDPGVNLLVYGDFNDHKNEPPIEAIAGERGAPGHLADIPLADKHGDRWTHYWRSADVYSRLDYFFASRGLLPEVDRARSGIYRSSFWADASDHRPIVLSLSPGEKP